jgi:hypothetical protein
LRASLNGLILIITMQERRRKNRKAGSVIPDRFSTVTVEFENGDVCEGKVKDLSPNGMSIEVPIPPNRIRDIIIKITSLDKSISTEQEIANFSSSDTGSRIGILFDGMNIFYQKA